MTAVPDAIRIVVLSEVPPHHASLPTTTTNINIRPTETVVLHAHKRAKGHASNRASGKGTCETHPLCAKANLTGDCCPAGNGLDLGCCAGL
jgi:hypothetical protein